MHPKLNDLMDWFYSRFTKERSERFDMSEYGTKYKTVDSSTGAISTWEIDGVNDLKQRVAVCTDGPRKGERALYEMAPGDPDTLGDPSAVKRKTTRRRFANSFIEGLNTPSDLERALHEPSSWLEDEQ